MTDAVVDPLADHPAFGAKKPNPDDHTHAGPGYSDSMKGTAPAASAKRIMTREEFVAAGYKAENYDAWVQSQGKPDDGA